MLREKHKVTRKLHSFTRYNEYRALQQESRRRKLIVRSPRLALWVSLAPSTLKLCTLAIYSRRSICFSLHHFCLMWNSLFCYDSLINSQKIGHTIKNRTISDVKRSEAERHLKGCHLVLRQGFLKGKSGICNHFPSQGLITLKKFLLQLQLFDFHFLTMNLFLLLLSLLF